MPTKDLIVWHRTETLHAAITWHHDWPFRLAVAKQLIRLACWVAGMAVRFEFRVAPRSYDDCL